MNKIGVIIGSSRPGRIGGQVTDWVLENLPKSDDVNYEIIDLQEWDLPMFNEVMPPMMGQYHNVHTKKWAEHIKGLHAFVMVTPEYNAGYPASLKNAIDYLKAEWKDKPTLVVSYGWDGGLSSNNQLREVLARVGNKLTETHPALKFNKDMFGEDGKIKDVDATFGDHSEEVEAAGQQLLDLLPIAVAA